MSQSQNQSLKPKLNNREGLKNPPNHYKLTLLGERREKEA